MRGGMPYDLQEVTGLIPSELKSKKEGSFASSINEPISVLDKRRSPSPSTSVSTSTPSSSLNAGAGGDSGSSTDNAVALPVSSDNTLQQKWPGSSSLPAEMGSGSVTVTKPAAAVGRKDEWAAELQPIPVELQRFGVGLEDWESLLSESAASPGQDQSLLRWISGDVEDASFSLKQLLQGGTPNEIDENAPGLDMDHSPIFETPAAPGGNLAFPATRKFASALNFNPQNGQSSHLLPFALSDQKAQILNPQMVLNPPQIQTTGTENMFLEPSGQVIQPLQKRHNLGFQKGPFLDLGQDFLLRKQQHLPLMGAKREPAPPPLPDLHNQHQQQQVICDQLCSAAELILAGNFSHAQGILARLNHQLSPNMVKPFQRAAFYFKEALQLPLFNPKPFKHPTPFDSMFKMGAYKMLSEVSPLIQFMNFTSNQTLLEALVDADTIHIIDFDIGCGAQWASFIQELPKRKNGVSSSSLKITAFASPSTHHPIELGLMHENLSQFAQEIGVSFELEVVNFDTFDPSTFSLSGKEAIAVNFPIWSCSTHLSAIPALLRFIKQLSPRIVVSLDRGCERTDLTMSKYLLHGLQYYEVLLGSIDAANITPDTANKIERFFFQPRIESMVMGRLHFPDPMPHWKTLFASAGYLPVVLSNFAETQADCVVKRTQVRGFHLEKKQASLVLCWQHRELMSASAWKC